MSHQTQTFQLFPSLPLELQITIWRTALCAEDPNFERLEPYNFARLYQWIKPTQSSHYFGTKSLKKVVYDGHRCVVMDACRLSRLVALEDWSRELERGPRNVPWIRSMKVQVVGVFKELAEEVRGRMERAEVVVVVVEDKKKKKEVKPGMSRLLVADELTAALEKVRVARQREDSLMQEGDWLVTAGPVRPDW